MNLSAGPSLVVGIALSRGGRDFSERDRALLDHLRPHLLNGRRDALARAEAASTLTALRNGLDVAGHGIVVLDHRAQPHMISVTARRLLARYFPDTPTRRLPEDVRAWALTGIAQPRLEVPHGVPAPLTVSRGDDWLAIRLIRGRGDGEHAILLVDEHHRPLSTLTLAGFGLTRRETEVLRAAARGLTNPQIAQELFISPRTVQKHLAHIYAKLGVSSRTGAVSRARDGEHRPQAHATQF